MDKPVRDATRDEWDEYAQSLDLDPSEYSRKEDLVAAVEAELLVRDAEDEPEATTDEDEEPKKKGKSKAPAGYENSPSEWHRAFKHARDKGNPEKTAILYANAHFQDEEFGG